MAVNKVVINTENGAETLIDLTNDTVTPDNLPVDITAHNAAGEEITGTISTLHGSQTEEAYPTVGYGIGECVKMSYTPTEKLILQPDSSFIDLCAPFSAFGDATAEDVAAGKIFTSAAGLRVEGTFTGANSSIDLDEEITEQENLIAQIKSALEDKASGGAPSIDGIPSGYARADYIQFSGTQTVDTGIICNQNTKIQVGFTREKSAQHYMFGVASSDNTASATAYLGGSWRFGNKYATKTITAREDMIYSAIVDNSEISVTGSATTISSVNEFETIGSLLLGTCRSSDGTVASSTFVGKIFFFAIWQGDEQVLKLVPVVSAEGTYRFWDMVSQTFFDSITDTALEGGNV